MNLTNALSFIESKPYEFPEEAFKILRKNNLMQLPRFRKLEVLNESFNETKIIIENLISVGCADLAVGRIYEGHINALLIIDIYGTEEQKNTYFNDAKEGKIFGVWNTERLFEALSYKMNLDNFDLKGAKTFCSGSLNILRPLITANDTQGKQMFILRLEDYPELQEDCTLWQVVGMESTVSHRIDFSNIKVQKGQRIGLCNDYDREPIISTGAIRFAAVQFGCAKAIVEITLNHLRRNGRISNSIQNSRIADFGILLQTGQLWFDGYHNLNSTNHDKHINYVNMLRTDILRICESILSLSERAIGIQGFLKHHPFEKKFRDLKVYLKQPNPDLVHKKIGQYYSTHGYDE